MSIANELSSDVATAVLARQKEGAEADSNELKDVVMKVHSTLRRLTAEGRKMGTRTHSSPESGQVKHTASGQS